MKLLSVLRGYDKLNGRLPNFRWSPLASTPTPNLPAAHEAASLDPMFLHAPLFRPALEPTTPHRFVATQMA